MVECGGLESRFPIISGRGFFRRNSAGEIPPSPLMYYVYVLKSVTGNFHYIGHSENISFRLKQHNAGKVRASKAHRPYTLIYFEEYQTKSEAQKREYYLKRGKGNFWLREHLKEKGGW